MYKMDGFLRTITCMSTPRRPSRSLERESTKQFSAEIERVQRKKTIAALFRHYLSSVKDHKSPIFESVLYRLEKKEPILGSLNFRVLSSAQPLAKQLFLLLSKRNNLVANHCADSRTCTQNCKKNIFLCTHLSS